MLKLFLFLSVSLFICEAVKPLTSVVCPSVRLKYGRVRYRQKGRFAKFVCNVGYIVAGEKYSTCVNGTWDGAIPKCVRASCKKVNPPINGLIYPSHRGAVLNFFCKPGFDVRGPTTLYCDGNNWDESLPTCLPTNTKPSLTCNFETADLCGWNHDLRHDFDWTRMNLKTPSGHLGTGPSFDHTLGNGKDGYYMYIESTSRKTNDTARLISPIYDKVADGNVCLEFFYHMHGASTGQLRVYLKRISDTWILYPDNAIFWKTGNHGDKWLHSLTDLGPINEDFQIIIEGVRGTSFFSDIAVDDIAIIPNCTIKDITTERDDVVTVDYIPTQSCFNRCDSDNVTNPLNNRASCGCDETCTDNNTCCPDYVALCVVGVTEDANVTTETTVMPVEEIVNKTTPAAPKSTTVSETLKPSSRVSIKPTKPAPTVLNVATTRPINVTKAQPSSPKLPTFTKYIVKQRISTAASTRTTQVDDDYVTIPVRVVVENEDAIVALPKTEAHPSVRLLKKQDETLQKSNTVVIVGILGGSVGLVLILGVILLRRFSCRRRRIRGSGSESQSDVRFLTSDEALDFTLAYRNE